MMGGLLLVAFAAVVQALTGPDATVLRHPRGIFTVREPSLCDPSVKQLSGYFELAGGDKKYFFWFFESRNGPSSSPTIMWLTGGPGCSSQLALLGENGPCSVEEDGKTTRLNPFSWNTNANAFWVDQPPGTGFSQGSYDHDEHGVARDMYAFLQAFFSHYPSYNKNFYVFGESYAGHYVPAVAHGIYEGNKNNDGTYIDLKGLAIGNGLTNPEVQYQWYPDMAFKSGTAPSVVSEQQYQAMKEGVSSCINHIRQCNQDVPLACQQAYQVCNMAELMPYQQTGLNPYDMRKKCEHPPLCYDFSQVDKFLNDPDVQAALGVHTKWEDCNFMVNLMFQGDWMKSFHQLLPSMLHDGIKVMVYAGDVDFVCNWLGNWHWVMELDWEGKEAFGQAEETNFLVPGKTQSYGKLRSSNGLSFLQVFAAGHMVPMDQPEAALEIVRLVTSQHQEVVIE